MAIVSSHFVPSEHPYQIIFDDVSHKIGMQIGSLIIIEENIDDSGANKFLSQTVPVVNMSCKKPVIQGNESFNSQMNFPILVHEAEVWKDCKHYFRICLEDESYISLSQFNYLVHETYVNKIDELMCHDTPSVLQRRLDDFGITVEWPKEIKHEITLFKAQLYSSGKYIKTWCQSKMEGEFYFYAKEGKDDDMRWFILHQAHNYFNLNNEYSFRFRTDVPEYKSWVEEVNRWVDNYCRHPK